MMVRFLIASFCILLVTGSRAEEVHVAVAANFVAPMKVISAAFEMATGHKVVLSVGSTGKFYAQIKNGAPFDAFLSADQVTPTRLMRENFGVPGSQFTYAVGKLVLWSAKSDFVDPQGAVLKKGNFVHMAIANPQQSPYGAAALETVKALNLSLSPKIVQGENIGQAYAFVVTGNAELGFVALSQVWENNHLTSGSMWTVPDNLYAPLAQDAILLKHGKDNLGASALLMYLKSDAAKKSIASFGYKIQ